MSAPSKWIPASSQTVGPYFRIGLEYLLDRPALSASEALLVRGKVLDRDLAPVSDAMLEFWSPACPAASSSDAVPSGFLRVGTDDDGAFTAALPRPQPHPEQNGIQQAPHFLVLVFARGLLRHLITRIYFEDEPANATDPVLQSIPAARRQTLIAQHRDGAYSWNVHLQGPEETVFFAW
ncbi:protocatechuate 3,4-dioxygenase subunit alpha [Acidobacteria bacterium AB60]|nr:protocatechuate 3,4-dioxygenase subunit alpha [Acidobacteria bacterium AB60]